ncbi:hypothetical protein DL93DRAFT_2168853 [Clavulina sp. PMI_390]|nr:hypothetical protein DL93DRAFT_2168853 [Clavulina sp. PMI_390]
MHFFSLALPLAFLATAVFGSPLEARGTGVEAVSSVKAAPAFTSIATIAHPEPGLHTADSTGVTAAAGVSKRNDFVELEKRTTIYGTLIVCTGTGCGGSCYGYSLPPGGAYVCYATVTGYSVYVSASTGLSYGVFVGPNCNQVLIPYVNTCYNVSPYTNTFSIN